MGLNRKKRETPPVPAKVTGEVEAKIIAVSCRDSPAGYSWLSLRLLEERSIVMVGIELSRTTIGGVLKNTPATISRGVLVHTAEGKSEDVLEVYHRRYDERRPVICMDEQCFYVCGRQYVGASRQRTRKGWVREEKSIVTEEYLEAEKWYWGRIIKTPIGFHRCTRCFRRRKRLV
jgi:hypothetical protein